MASQLIVDTSGVVALYDADAAEHDAFVATAFAPGTMRLIPAAILSEIDFMLTVRVNPLAGDRFVDAIVDGFFEIESFTHADAKYVRELLKRYSNLKLGLADGAVMALAERMHCPRILTTDQRHFRAVRPKAFAEFQIGAGDFHVEEAKGSRRK